jgi:hypothetical protein
MTSSLPSLSPGGIVATDNDDGDEDVVEMIGDATDGNFVDNIDEDEDDDPPELVLLLPGQCLRVQVGDISNSHKAWKKIGGTQARYSPRAASSGLIAQIVRRNLVTLLHAIGEDMTAMVMAADGRPFLGASAGKIGRAYLRRLGVRRRHTTINYKEEEEVEEERKTQ